MLRVLALVYACGIGERRADDLAAALARAGCGSHARPTADHVQVLPLVARRVAYSLALPAFRRSLQALRSVLEATLLLNITDWNWFALK